MRLALFSCNFDLSVNCHGQIKKGKKAIVEGEPHSFKLSSLIVPVGPEAEQTASGVHDVPV